MIQIHNPVEKHSENTLDMKIYPFPQTVRPLSGLCHAVDSSKQEAKRSRPKWVKSDNVQNYKISKSITSALQQSNPATNCQTEVDNWWISRTIFWPIHIHMCIPPRKCNSNYLEHKYHTSKLLPCVKLLSAECTKISECINKTK